MATHQTQAYSEEYRREAVRVSDLRDKNRPILNLALSGLVLTNHKEKCMFSRILKIAMAVCFVSACSQVPVLTTEETQRYKLAQENAQEIHDAVQSCFTDSQVSKRIGNDFIVTGVSLGIGPSHPSEKYCSSCIDCTFGFCRAVTRCCQPHQGTQCQPCYDGK